MSSLSVGEVAGSLGVAPSTVRMWGHRYGLTASDRSAGGHRRYTAEDVDRLRRMHAAVISGVSPAAAAAGVVDPPPAGRVGPRAAADGRAGHELGTGHETRTGPAVARVRRGGPGGAVLAVPGAGREARGLARAASRLDGAGACDLVLAALRERGTLAVWDEVLRPVLVAAGLHWERTGTGIDVEHLLTQAVSAALSLHVAGFADGARDDAVLLAGGPEEDHVLALAATRAALAERGVPARFLGPRTPMAVIAAAARRTRTPAVLVWLTFPDPSATSGLAELGAAHRGLAVLVGGPGWTGQRVEPATACRSLGEAVALLADCRADRSTARRVAALAV